MYAKKLVALLLSVVMAVTMLTACGGGSNGNNGGGSSSDNELSLSTVNSFVVNMGGDVRVGSSNQLNRAVNTVANLMAERTSANITREFIATALSDNLTFGTMCLYYIVPRVALANAGGTPEQAAAELIIALKAQLGSGYTSYAASAASTESADGVAYWLVVVSAE